MICLNKLERWGWVSSNFSRSRFANCSAGITSFESGLHVTWNSFITCCNLMSDSDCVLRLLWEVWNNRIFDMPQRTWRSMGSLLRLNVIWEIQSILFVRAFDLCKSQETWTRRSLNAASSYHRLVWVFLLGKFSELKRCDNWFDVTQRFWALEVAEPLIAKLGQSYFCFVSSFILGTHLRFSMLGIWSATCPQLKLGNSSVHHNNTLRLAPSTQPINSWRPHGWVVDCVWSRVDTDCGSSLSHYRKLKLPHDPTRQSVWYPEKRPITWQPETPDYPAITRLPDNANCPTTW